MEEPKVWALESSIPRSSNLEPSTKAQRKKKKDCRQWDQQDRQGQKGFTPATRVNAAEPGKANKKKNNDWNQNRLGGAARNLN